MLVDGTRVEAGAIRRVHSALVAEEQPAVDAANVSHDHRGVGAEAAGGLHRSFRLLPWQCHHLSPSY